MEANLINPLKLSLKVEKEVCKDDRKKYYRFRYARFYSGIATADCVGCNLRCFYCWSQFKAWNTKEGKFYSSDEVKEKLISIAEKRNCKKLRVSGGEPTIGFSHLLNLLKKTPKEYLFILETNGILLSRESYIKELSKFPNVHVRLSLKGPYRIYEKVTLAPKETFYLQIRAIENLLKYEVSFHIAIMRDLYTKEDLKSLYEELYKIDKRLLELVEEEYLIKYPFVLKNARSRGIKI